MKMRRFFRGFRYGEKGFTLIELLVVIAILGIIAAIVVPNFGTFFGRGRTQAQEMELRMVQTGAMAWLSDNGSCPADGATLETNNYFGAGTTLECTYVITDILSGTVVVDCDVAQTCP